MEIDILSDPTLNRHDFSGIDSLGFRQYPGYPLTYVYNPSLHQGHSVYYPYGFVLPFSQIGGLSLVALTDFREAFTGLLEVISTNQVKKRCHLKNDLLSSAQYIYCLFCTRCF